MAAHGGPRAGLQRPGRAHEPRSASCWCPPPLHPPAPTRSPPAVGGRRTQRRGWRRRWGGRWRGRRSRGEREGRTTGCCGSGRSRRRWRPRGEAAGQGSSSQARQGGGGREGRTVHDGQQRRPGWESSERADEREEDEVTRGRAATETVHRRGARLGLPIDELPRLQPLQRDEVPARGLLLLDSSCRA